MKREEKIQRNEVPVNFTLKKGREENDKKMKRNIFLCFFGRLREFVIMFDALKEVSEKEEARKEELREISYKIGNILFSLIALANS